MKPTDHDAFISGLPAAITPLDISLMIFSIYEAYEMPMSTAVETAEMAIEILRKTRSTPLDTRNTKG